jgi:hypothetical protein
VRAITTLSLVAGLASTVFAPPTAVLAGRLREGRLAGTALLRLLLVGDRFEPCRFVSSGDALEHGKGGT